MAARKAVAPKAEHPLSHLIPDKSWAEDYVSRTIRGVRDLELLHYAHLTQKNVLMQGDTGGGKTHMAMAYGAEYGYPVITVACNGGIDPNTFWGGFVPDPDTGGIRWVDTDILGGVRHGALILIDELNFMPGKTGAAFHSALDRRRFVTILELGNEHVPCHPETFFIGAYNPGYEGTRPLNQAFKNRYTIHMHLDYDAETEQALVCMPVVLEIAGKLREARKNGDIDTPVSTNMLREFEELAVDLSKEFAIDNFITRFLPEERDAVRTVFELLDNDLEMQLEQLTSDD